MYISVTKLFWPLSLALLLAAPPAYPDARDQAKRLHDRLAGVPPSNNVLDLMQADIEAGDPLAAAYRAMEHPAFYDVTLVNFATPWTNADQDVFAGLNDFTATVVGMVRDDVDFREVLSGDLLYIGDSGSNLPAYSLSDNRHYEELQSRGLELKSVLERSTQSSQSALPSTATAGVMTSRAAAKAYFIDGTNRAMFRFTMMNFLCHDLESLKDVTRAPDRIRQDVTRSPGGDSRIFLNNCVGCHAGMDPMAQAFAYYDFTHDEADSEGESGTLVYNRDGDIDAATGSRVKRKYHINSENFPSGFVTPDDSWDNRWRAGKNAVLEWDPALSGSGSGAKTLGQELAHSGAFASCQVKKAFRATCLREPQDGADRARVVSITDSFTANGYAMKQVFAETAVYCMGD